MGDDAACPEPGYGTVPGTPLAQMGTHPNQYNPFGIAFAPDGTLYFVDIHITCKGAAHRVRPGRLTAGGSCGSRPGRDPGDAGDGGRRVRLPDQRDGVRAGPAALPLPDGEVVAPLSGPSENPARPPGPSRTPRRTTGFG